MSEHQEFFVSRQCCGHAAKYTAHLVSGTTDRMSPSILSDLSCAQDELDSLCAELAHKKAVLAAEDKELKEILARDGEGPPKTLKALCRDFGVDWEIMAQARKMYIFHSMGG